MTEKPTTEKPRVERSVWSIYWPETRAVVDELWAERPHAMYERNYDKSQDDLHMPFLDGWRAWANLGGVALGDQFPHAYPTNGASETINNLILPGMRVHVFDGEYEGYAAIADARGVPVSSTDRYLAGQVGLPTRFEGALDEVFFVSMPSAIDGEYWPFFKDWLSWMADECPRVRFVVDLTYIGAVRHPQLLDFTRHRNVSHVLFSLSKPFGVYYHRIGGVFAREPVAALHGNRWFKNLFALRLGTELLRRHTARDIPTDYRLHQERALNRLVAAGLLPPKTKASNVVLLARSLDGPAEYRRTGGHFRYCLSREMDREINPTREGDST